MPNLKISVVIPVCNEEAAIGACLEALLTQEHPIEEIIVVDNGSTDKTLEVITPYLSRITLLHEARRGVIYARNTGFDNASGDIIGRIDGDTRVMPNWSKMLLANFEVEPRIDAVTGPLSYYDMPLKRIGLEIDTLVRKSVEYFLKDYKFLQGANMALRKDAWQSIRAQVCHDARIHEDIDIAIHLGMVGRRVVFDPDLIASVSGRRVEDSTRDFYTYLEMLPKSYELHHVPGRHTAQALARFLLVNHIPLKVIHKLYDPTRNALSVHKFFAQKHTHRSL